MLRRFAHPVACYCVLLGVVGQSLRPVERLAACKWTQQLTRMLDQQRWELLRPFARSLRKQHLRHLLIVGFLRVGVAG